MGITVTDKSTLRIKGIEIEHEGLRIERSPNGGAIIHIKSITIPEGNWERIRESKPEVSATHMKTVVTDGRKGSTSIANRAFRGNLASASYYSKHTSDYMDVIGGVTLRINPSWVVE